MALSLLGRTGDSNSKAMLCSSAIQGGGINDQQQREASHQQPARERGWLSRMQRKGSKDGADKAGVKSLLSVEAAWTGSWA